MTEAVIADIDLGVVLEAQTFIEGPSLAQKTKKVWFGDGRTKIPCSPERVKGGSSRKSVRQSAASSREPENPNVVLSRPKVCHPV